MGLLRKILGTASSTAKKTAKTPPRKARRGGKATKGRRTTKMKL